MRDQFTLVIKNLQVCFYMQHNAQFASYRRMMLGSATPAPPLANYVTHDPKPRVTSHILQFQTYKLLN